MPWYASDHREVVWGGQQQTEGWSHRWTSPDNPPFHNEFLAEGEGFGLCDSQIPEYFRKFETHNPLDLLKTRGPGTKQVQCPTGASACHPRHHADNTSKRPVDHRPAS